MTTNLTTKETAMLTVFAVSGNSDWLSASDLQDTLKWTKQAVGGVMSRLAAKGMITDGCRPELTDAGSVWFENS